VRRLVWLLVVAALGCRAPVVDPGPGDGALADAGGGDVGTADVGTADVGMTDAGRTDDGGTDDGGTDDGGTDDGGTDAGGADAFAPDAWSGPPASRLPFSYTRADEGTPVSAEELSALTTRYLELLEGTRYFDMLEERVHGWPETDPEGRFWYGTWWSGVVVQKRSGHVTYRHVEVGADNNGLRTAPLLEAACFAYLLWPNRDRQHLVDKLVRGFSSWVLAMERESVSQQQTLMTRAHYPVSVESNEGDRALSIDYSLNRPGVDNGATEYVRLTDNPYWGDVYIKNKRSKDCIGQMFRALGHLGACDGALESAPQADLDQLRALYQAWSRQVEEDGWVIATLDQALQLWLPMESLAVFVNTANTECAGIYALRLVGHGDPGDLDCENGIALPERLGGDNIGSSNKQMLRAYHEAAAVQALEAGQDAHARALVEGMAERLEDNLDRIEAGDFPPNLDASDFATLIMEAAMVGVPLTSREVRWLHQAIDQAHTAYLAPGLQPAFDVFNPSTPDGDYPFEVSGAGMHLVDLGLPLGSCASAYRNPAGRPLLDCDMIEAAQ